MELAPSGGRSISLGAIGKEEEKLSVDIDKVVDLGEEILLYDFFFLFFFSCEVEDEVS